MKVKKLRPRRHGSGRTRRKVGARINRGSAISTQFSRAAQMTSRALDLGVLRLDPALEAKIKLSAGPTLGDLVRHTETTVKGWVGTKNFSTIEAKLKTSYGLAFAEQSQKSY